VSAHPPVIEPAPLIAPASVAEPAATRPVLPLGAALVVALAAGPVLDAGFPDKGIWPLTFLGIGLVLVTLIGRTVASAALVGFVGGASFYFTHIFWASLFLGPVPMSALSVLESLFFAAGAVAIALAYRWLPRAFPTPLGRLGLLPVAIAGLWTAREAWASVWPYGGFAWGRVALSQSESPLAPLFAWLGISGVSFVMVLLVAATIEAIRFVGVSGLTRALAPAALAFVLLAAPAFPVATDGTLRVAAVQGNAKAGYFDQREPGDLLQAQVDATAPLFGQKDIDVVLWPEGATDRSPLSDPYTASVFDLITEEFDAPLVGWAVTERDGRFYNTEILWEPGKGATDLYDKRHPVPFGEYVPDRAFWEPFAPDLIGLIQREYTPGSTDTVFEIGDVLVGINICFDIVDDQVLRESVQEGAQLIFASTNNADFGMTDESAQQLAVARIRAIELGRSVVNISTVGISAVIAPDGSIQSRLPWFEPGSMVEDVALSDTVTPAILIGRQLEWFVAGLGLGALLAGGAYALGRRRRG